MGAGRPGQPLDSGQRGSCRLRIGNLPKVSPPGTGAKTEDAGRPHISPGWSPSLLVFDDTPDTLKLAGADGKWFLGAGWPANSNAFFNKYGSMQANGTVERKLLTAIQKWRADGSQPGSVYATCDPAPADFKPGRPSAYHSPHNTRPAYPKKPVVAP